MTCEKWVQGLNVSCHLYILYTFSLLNQKSELITMFGLGKKVAAPKINLKDPYSIMKYLPIL